MDYVQLLHAHKGIIYLFLAFLTFKVLFSFINKEKFQSFKNTKGAKIAEMVLGTLVLASGVALLIQTPASGGWLHAKVTLAILAIPVAIIGFKKDKAVLTVLSLAVFFYVFYLGIHKGF